jgi:hypothetical protein
MRFVIVVDAAAPADVTRLRRGFGEAGNEETNED